jgi:hypothetical protein
LQDDHSGPGGEKPNYKRRIRQLAWGPVPGGRQRIEHSLSPQMRAIIGFIEDKKGAALDWRG